jgi:hypothetical protein
VGAAAPHHALLHREVENAADLRDAMTEVDVELSIEKRRRHFVLDDLTRTREPTKRPPSLRLSIVRMSSRTETEKLECLPAAANAPLASTWNPPVENLLVAGASDLGAVDSRVD